MEKEKNHKILGLNFTTKNLELTFNSLKFQPVLNKTGKEKKLHFHLYYLS